MVLFTTLSQSAFAAPEEPAGQVILTVNGHVEQSVQFDLHTLKQLPEHEILTQNPWEEGAHRYVGFDPNDLLKQLSANANVIRLTAFNQYITEIPLADFDDVQATIAYEMDGEEMSVRNKGPLMVVYDFDQYPELRNEAYYGRSIWQIQSLEVLMLEE